MYFKTKAIVINQIKYSDTSLIVTLYTEYYGRLTFMVQGVFKKKSKFPPVYFLPLTLLEVEASVTPKRQLQRMKEASVVHPFQTIPFEPAKNAITLFLSEMLYKTLREEEKNESLFLFLENSIELFDRMDSGMANFHLWFLVNLSKHLGFYPTNNYSHQNQIFDLQNGRFYQPVLKNISETEKNFALHLHQLLDTVPETLDKIELDHNTRNLISENLVEYYHIHMGHLGNIKSLQVLQGVFA